MMGLFQNKLVLMGLAGVVIAGMVWYSFLRDDDTALLETQDLTQATEVDGEIVSTLLQLRAVSLSGTIFSDPAFQGLKDFSTPITPEPAGRPNPFAPLNLRTVTAPSPSFAASTSTSGSAQR